MKKYSLTRMDKKFVKVFEEMGVPETVSKALVYISKVDTCMAVDIEQGARLRQPAVSIAMSQLYELGWIDKTTKSKVGKGRPIYIYKLIKDIDDVFNYFKEKKQEDFDRFQQAIKEYDTLRSKQKTYSS